MQIANTVSNNLFDSYKMSKKEAQMIAPFVDTNFKLQAIDETKLVIRSKTEELQSQVEQIKKEYLDGRNEVLDWANKGLELRLNYNLISLEEIEENYPMYAQALYAIHEDKNMANHGWDYVSAEHSHHKNYHENKTHQYTKDDFHNAINNIEKSVTQVLEQEFEKDPTSDYTKILILFKAQIQAMPEVWKQEKQQVLQFAKQSEYNKHTLIDEYSMATEGELERLNRISARIGNVHPELKEQLSDSVRILYDYYHSSFEDAFSLVDPNELNESFEDFVLNLSSRFSAIDNTEILLNLSQDFMQTNTKESKTYESLIDRIRSKLKGNDDSILQQVMSKITNGVKTAGASGIGEGA